MCIQYSGSIPGLERIDKMAFFNFSPELVELSEKAMQLCAPQFAELDRMAEYNGQRILKAFIDNKISDIHMKGTNGYGYGDDGRDKLDAVFAQSSRSPGRSIPKSAVVSVWVPLTKL